MENAARPIVRNESIRGHVHPDSPHMVAAFSEVTALLHKGVEDGVFPGAVLLVARDGHVMYHKAAGAKSIRLSKEVEPRPMTPDTVFDLAGLTQAIGTATLFMRLIESGKVKLEDRATIYLQGFSVHHKSPITIGDLLAHNSGLAASSPFYEDLIRENAGARLGILTSKGARDYVINAINRSSLKIPPRTRQVPSEIGYILLGHIAEVLTGLSLEKALHKYVVAPLGLKTTSYIDLSLIRRRGIQPVTDLIAPTEQCAWRQRLVWGEVHDDNAWAMGGIAGHSGIFSTAFDVHILARELLFASRGGSNFLKRETVHTFFKGPSSLTEGGDPPTYRYGWDAPNRDNGMLESGLSSAAVGINGFTGCSLWLEPERGVEILLLSNRVHPSRSNRKISTFRPQLYAAVLQAQERVGASK